MTSFKFYNIKKTEKAILLKNIAIKYFRMFHCVCLWYFWWSIDLYFKGIGAITKFVLHLDRPVINSICEHYNKLLYELRVKACWFHNNKWHPKRAPQLTKTALSSFWRFKLINTAEIQQVWLLGISTILKI